MVMYQITIWICCALPLPRRLIALLAVTFFDNQSKLEQVFHSKCFTDHLVRGHFPLHHFERPLCQSPHTRWRHGWYQILVYSGLGKIEVQ